MSMPLEKEKELLSLSGNCLFSIDDSKINIDDLMDTRPGDILRFEGDIDNVIRVFTPDNNEFLGVVAGWISEE